jgi:hypothetical protein
MIKLMIIQNLQTSRQNVLHDIYTYMNIYVCMLVLFFNS